MSILSEINLGLKRKGYLGFLLVIDELGKFLEYETRHHEVNDIYLLQLLAEETLNKTGFVFSLVVLLHQSMDQYAKSLSEAQRNEWSKIQGRFESIPFIESSEEVLKIISTAIIHKLDDKELKHVNNEVTKTVATLSKLGLTKNDKENVLYQNLFKQCYPLHPVSALILPILCQKIAQNERTLFSYLGSKEDFGFYDCIKNIKIIGKIGSILMTFLSIY